MKEDSPCKTGYSAKISATICGPFRNWFAVLSLLLILACLPGLTFLTPDFSPRSWFSPTNARLIELDEFEESFGNEEAFVVVVHRPSGVFHPDSLSFIQNLTDELWMIKGIKRVDSLTNYNWIDATDGELDVSPFVPNISSLTFADAQRLKEKASAFPYFYGYLLDEIASTTLVYARLNQSLEADPDYDRIQDDITKVLSSLKPHPAEVYLTGAGALNVAFKVAAEKDVLLTTPLLWTAVLVILWYFYRRFVLVLLPGFFISLVNVVTFGSAGYLGITLNSMTASLPMIIIAIGMADMVHLLNSYQLYVRLGQKSTEAVLSALKKIFLPTFLTTITTMIGFASLNLTEIPLVRDLGTAAAIACGVAWIFTLTLAAPVLMWLPARWTRPHGEARQLRGSQWLQPLVSFTSRQWAPCFVMGIVLFVGLPLLVEQIKVDSEPNAYFTDDVPIKIANDLVYDKLGGFNGPEIVIDSGAHEGVYDPGFLQKVERLELWLESKPYTGQVISVLDQLRVTNQKFHENDPAQHKLPETREATAQELLFLTLSLPQGMDLSSMVTSDNRQVRLSVLWDLKKSSESLEAVAEIEAKMQELGLTGYVTGKYFLLFRLNQYVVETLIVSVGVSFTLVSLIMLLVFKSPLVALGAMIANMIPVAVGGWALLALGKDINIGTAMVISICLGIAVDDSIHFLSTYLQRKAEGLDGSTALTQTFQTTGSALLVTTLILVIGFGSFTLGAFVPNVELGLLCVVVLIAALLTDFIWLPSFMVAMSKAKLLGPSSRKNVTLNEAKELGHK